MPDNASVVFIFTSQPPQNAFILCRFSFAGIKKSHKELDWMNRTIGGIVVTLYMKNCANGRDVVVKEPVSQLSQIEYFLCKLLRNLLKFPGKKLGWLFNPVKQTLIERLFSNEHSFNVWPHLTNFLGRNEFRVFHWVVCCLV